MLAVRQQPSVPKQTPNLLPCGVRHNGPVNASERYWKPETESDGSSTAYFRGRKLCGKTLKLPNGYDGVVLESSDQRIVQPLNQPFEVPVDEDDDRTPIPQNTVETRVMNQKAHFDEIVVWGHEALPQNDDEYVKGMEEWVAFAEAVSVHRLWPIANSADRSRCTPTICRSPNHDNDDDPSPGPWTGYCRHGTKH